MSTTVHPPMKPQISYVICAVQRSGSFLLCEALKNTGLAGFPEEYFLKGEIPVPKREPTFDFGFVDQLYNGSLGFAVTNRQFWRQLYCRPPAVQLLA